MILATILAFDSVLETFRRIRRPPWEGDSCFLLEMEEGMLALGDFHMHLAFHRHLGAAVQDYNDDESWTVAGFMLGDEHRRRGRSTELCDSLVSMGTLEPHASIFSKDTITM